MVRLAFDVYPPPVTSLGSRLVRLTSEDYGPGTFYQHALGGVGVGLIVVERDQAVLTAVNFAIGNYVLVRDLDLSATDTLNVVGGFFLERGDFTLISDPGRSVLRFGGPSTIAYLARGVMGPESLSPAVVPPQLDHQIVDGYWRWGGDTYGGVLRRALIEDNLQDPPALPMIAATYPGTPGVNWDDNDDSNGDPWPSFDGDFRTETGTNILELAAQLFGYGIEWDIDARTFDIYAYNAGGFGTDHSATVQFRRDAENIGQELKRSIKGQLPLTHVLVRTTDHPEGAFVESPSYSPGDPVRKAAYQSPDIAGDAATSAALQSRATNLMALRGLAEDGVSFYTSKPGTSGTQYQPGPNYSPGATDTGGDYWVGDYVLLDSGTEDFDYNDAVKRIEGIAYELSDAGEWNVRIDIGPRVGSGTTDLNIPVGATPVGITLCDALIPGTETVLRLYFSNDNSGLAPAVSALWDTDSAGDGHSGNQLKTAPDSSYGSGDIATASVGTGGIDVRLGEYSYGPIGAALAAALAAGGATIRGQIAARSRSGIGITEANQHNIHQGTLRVLQGATNTVRGVAYGGHSLASQAGSAEYAAQTQTVNRTFPPAAASNELDAVAGTVSTDYIDLELGYRSFSTSTTGASHRYTSDQASDYPEDDDDIGPANAWIEIRYVGSASGSGNHPDLVGTESSAARCDHRHHVISNRAPTVLDNAAAGYPETTQWTDTTSGATYLLIDGDAGEWLQIASGVVLPIDVGDIVGLTAAAVPIEDDGAYYTGTEVEAALQEVGADVVALEAADVTLDARIDALEVSVDVHDESLTDGAEQFIFAGGDIVTVVGVPN